MQGVGNARPIFLGKGLLAEQAIQEEAAARPGPEQELSRER